MRVCSPRLMASQPCSWAGVGASNVDENQERLTSENRSSAAITGHHPASRAHMRRLCRRICAQDLRLAVVAEEALDLARQRLGAGQVVGLHELDALFVLLQPAYVVGDVLVVGH